MNKLPLFGLLLVSVVAMAQDPVAMFAAGPTANLSWTPSTDDVGVTGYRVERCSGVGCSNFVLVGSPTGASYSDVGLSYSTTYSWRVKAVDGAGNMSTYSNIASITTGANPVDTTPPTPPGTLIVVVPPPAPAAPEAPAARGLKKQKAK